MEGCKNISCEMARLEICNYSSCLEQNGREIQLFHSVVDRKNSRHGSQTRMSHTKLYINKIVYTRESPKTHEESQKYENIMFFDSHRITAGAYI